MKRQAIFRRPVVGMFLALLAGMFFVSGALAKPVIHTNVTVDVTNCKASYGNNNCGGLGNAGDICVAKGPNTKVELRFNLTGGGANAAFTKMEIKRVPPGNPCPDWVTDDFPQFDPANCTYSPGGPGKVLQITDDNHHEAEWEYSIFVDLDDTNCPDPVEIDPIIKNGGNN